MTATLRFWAAAREAAGAAEETVRAAASVADALAQAVDARGGEQGGGAELSRVLARSSVLLDGVQVGKADRASASIPEGAVIEILPPFAGG